MKKGLIVLTVCLMLVTTAAVMARPNNGPAGKSNTAHLYLYEKDPITWIIVDDGAWGKVTFKASGFVFNGHGLVPGMSYTLINYVDPWPGTPATFLAGGTANSDGDLHLAGSANLAGSGKIWLVLSNDVNCGVGMTGWNPTEYLFEYDLI